MMVQQVSVDLDRASVVHLLRVYFSAKRILPNVPLELTVSPSGVGFHLKLHKQVTIEEDLKIRALLWDHADRLVYALKKWALNQNEKYVDLVFDEKNEGVERPLPLEEILKPQEKEVTNINDLLDRGENEKADEEIKKLAKEIEPQVGTYKGRQYVGCIAFKGDEVREPLEKVCTDIAEKDNTFTWKLYPAWMPEWDWFLALFDSDKDRLWKRLVWLKNKAKKDEKLILKNLETRMWIKERTST